MSYGRSAFSTVASPPHLFRVAPTDNASLFREDNGDDDQGFVGIFNDDEREFRVAYASSSREGAYREALVALRPSAELIAELNELELDEDETDAIEGIGIVPISWLVEHHLETLILDGACICVDVVAEDTLRVLSASRGINLDAEDILSYHVHIARRIARQIYAQAEGFDGIAYPSRAGRPVEHFALFEGRDGGVLRNREVLERAISIITVEDPALIDVVNEFRLRIPGYAESQDLVGSPLVWHERLALVIAEHGLVGEPFRRDDGVALWIFDGRYVIANRTGERVEAYGILNGEQGFLDVGSANLSASASVYELGCGIAGFLKGEALGEPIDQMPWTPPSS